MLEIGPAVEQEDDLVVFNFDVGDDDAVAGLGGEAAVDDHVEIAIAGRFKLSVGYEGKAFVAARKRAHGESLLAAGTAMRRAPAVSWSGWRRIDSAR